MASFDPNTAAGRVSNPQAAQVNDDGDATRGASAGRTMSAPLAQPAPLIVTQAQLDGIHAALSRLVQNRSGAMVSGLDFLKSDPVNARIPVPFTLDGQVFTLKWDTATRSCMLREGEVASGKGSPYVRLDALKVKVEENVYEQQTQQKRLSSEGLYASSTSVVPDASKNFRRGKGHVEKYRYERKESQAEVPPVAVSVLPGAERVPTELTRSMVGGALHAAFPDEVLADFGVGKGKKDKDVSALHAELMSVVQMDTTNQAAFLDKLNGLGAMAKSIEGEFAGSVQKFVAALRPVVLRNLINQLLDGETPPELRKPGSASKIEAAWASGNFKDIEPATKGALLKKLVPMLGIGFDVAASEPPVGHGLYLEASPADPRMKVSALDGCWIVPFFPDPKDEGIATHVVALLQHALVTGDAKGSQSANLAGTPAFSPLMRIKNELFAALSLTGAGAAAARIQAYFGSHLLVFDEDMAKILSPHMDLIGKACEEGRISDTDYRWFMENMMAHEDKTRM